MSRTTRTVHPRMAYWAAGRPPRQAAMLLKGAKHFRSNKCQDAAVDAEGNHKLNTWSECLSKGASWANRKIRRAGKVQAARQLEEMRHELVRGP